MTVSQPLIAASGIVKGYRTAAGYVPVLEGLDVTVGPGEMMAITGASGVGKSTLLHVLGTLDRPERGTLTIAGEDMLGLSESRLREARNRTLGFVFQFHHLLPEFTAIENVMMPLLIARRPAPAARVRALALLEEMGIAERRDHRPGALSGGEQQRVAVARGLAQGPRALLADEPTGNLDRETGRRLQELLRRVCRDKGVTIVVVTHDEELAGSCDRTLRLASGRLHPPGLSG
jgi:lipoprotein-releasing system ATP-binding protein